MIGLLPLAVCVILNPFEQAALLQPPVQLADDQAVPAVPEGVTCLSCGSQTDSGGNLPCGH